MTTTAPTLVEPTQGDKESADILIEDLIGVPEIDRRMVVAEFLLTHRLSTRSAVVEECAAIAENAGKTWHAKEQRYRKAGNPGPYLGTPTGFSIAAAIRKLKESDNAG